MPKNDISHSISLIEGNKAFWHRVSIRPPIGKLVSFMVPNMPNTPIKITAMVSIYNEEDIIVEVIEHLLDNDLHVVALDNGSNDNSFSLCKKLASKYGFTLDRWCPTGIDLEQLTLRLYKLAAKQSPDWLIFSDGDEIMETQQQGRSIRQVIEHADAADYNLIQYDRFDFFMTKKDRPDIQSPVRRLRYYSWQGDFNYRAFKHVPGIQAFPSFAHYPLFPVGYPYRIYPEKLALRHYPYRSRTHAYRKIANLLEKFGENPEEPKNWQQRYIRIASEGQHILPADHHRLNQYHEDKNWITQPVYTPFTDNQPTREQLFTSEGFLRYRPEPTINWISAI